MEQLTKTEKYRQILQQVVAKHAQMVPPSGQIEYVSNCDPVRNSYLLLRVGFDRVGRAHHILFHFRLQGDKVLIEHDGIEYGIARDLVEAGIAPEDIVFNMYRTPRHYVESLAA